jgi:hypothetical protein
VLSQLKDRLAATEEFIFNFKKDSKNRYEDLIQLEKEINSELSIVDSNVDRWEKERPMEHCLKEKKKESGGGVKTNINKQRNSGGKEEDDSDDDDGDEVKKDEDEGVEGGGGGGGGGGGFVKAPFKSSLPYDVKAWNV